MSRQELEVSERRPFYVYLDEFQNFVTPTMEAILSGARKYCRSHHRQDDQRHRARKKQGLVRKTDSGAAWNKQWKEET